MPKMGENFLGPKSSFLNFSLNLCFFLVFFVFFEIVLDDRYGKMGKNENSCYAQIWEMCQMLEPGVHCYFVRVVFKEKTIRKSSP